ncbi:MAG TPA: hypothetical protein DIT90_11495 [Dehalococcoidia bacterium]|nr:hypothetical protein [Dehalococcoidia bacterium]
MAIQDYITNGHYQEEEEDQPRVKFDVNERAPARIKVIGVGDGGGNCVKRMMRHSVPGVTFDMVNADIKALETDDPAVKPNRRGPLRAARLVTEVPAQVSPVICGGSAPIS